MQSYTSSASTSTFFSTHTSAILVNSSRVNTFPTGLCGVLTITIFVLSVKAALNSSMSIFQSWPDLMPLPSAGGWSGTKTVLAPWNRMDA